MIDHQDRHRPRATTVSVRRKCGETGRNTISAVRRPREQTKRDRSVWPLTHPIRPSSERIECAARANRVPPGDARMQPVYRHLQVPRRKEKAEQVERKAVPKTHQKQIRENRMCLHVTVRSCPVLQCVPPHISIAVRGIITINQGFAATQSGTPLAWSRGVQEMLAC